MANNVYIGMRYVPIFDGAWDSTKTYEALVIVEYGNNTYTSKKPVPAGTLPTNTTYWALTGNYNGYISQHTQQISALETAVSEIPTNRKFVLVGDSFGCGIIGGGAAWTTGWIDYMNQLFPGKCFYYDPAGDQSFEGSSGFTTNSQKNFIGELNYTYNNKLGTTDPNTITDVVVLGGTNEDSTQTKESIALAIDTFCARSRQLFPNAEISIGIVGLEGRTMVFEKQTYQGYRLGSMRNGAKFLTDCINLGTLRTYDSGYNHWSAAGYALYNPFIAEMIIKGTTDYYFEETITGLAFTSDIVMPSGTSFTPAMIVGVYKDHLLFTLYATNTYSAPHGITATKIQGSSSTRSGTMIKLNISKFNYVYKLNEMIWFGKYLYTNDNSGSYDPVVMGDCEFRIGFNSTLNDFVIGYMAATPIRVIHSFDKSLLMPDKISPPIYSFRL